MGVQKSLRFLNRFLKIRKLKKRGLSIGVKRKTGETRPVVSYFQGSILSRTLTGTTFVALAALIVHSGGYYRWPRLTIGDRAVEDIYASIGFTFRDDAKTESLRQEAAQKMPLVYRLDKDLVMNDVDELIALIGKASQAEDPESATKLFEEVNGLLPSLGPDEVRRLIVLPNATELLTELKPIIRGACGFKISPVAVVYSTQETGVELRSGDEVRTMLRDDIKEKLSPPANEEISWLLRAIAHYFTSDLTPRFRSEDTEAVKKLRDFARKSIPDQDTTVPQGAKIIERGEEIGPAEVAQIEEMRRALSEQRTPRARLLSLAGAVLAVSALTLGSAAFLARFHRSVVASNSRLILVAVLVLMSVGVSKILTYPRPASVFLIYFLGYPIAVPFGSFIVSMMLGLRLAAFVTIPTAILVGMGLGNSLSPVLVGMFGGWAAAFFAGGVRHRKDFIRTGAAVALVSGLTIVAIGALTSTKVGSLMAVAGGGFAVSFGSLLMAAAFLPAFEWAFKTPTNISLAELTDSNHPLLKRLIMEAPGTYYHSLMVGNLAESAAEAVEASPLLARVGSYFHDIGKLKKPLYFSENEAFGKSKHDTLNPSMSNLIILSHTKDGVDLACKNKLNRALVDIIKQHHGTSLNYYFYRRAKETNENGSPVDDKDYRYPGPRPQSREGAIIMLADSVEAASRSLEKPTAAKIRAVVRNVIRTKFEDGQLDECDLTLKDLHKIEETFDRILVNTLHQRVKYPEDTKEAKKETSERPVQELAKGGKPPGK